MANLLCPISGISYSCEHIPATIPHQPHPIFCISDNRLLGLYAKYVQGHLTATDSYLLFLAYLNSIDSLEWHTPCSLKPTSPTTQRIISCNLKQLIEVTQQSNAIQVPSFKQPGFVISAETSNLINIHIYIQAWQKNITAYHQGYVNERLEEKLKAVEDKLQYLLLSGEEQLSASKLADWAELSAAFPKQVTEKYKLIIRSCYNSDKMFKLKVSEIQEVLEYCYANIMPGSIFIYALARTLKHGIELNQNYLGYTLMSGTSPTTQTETPELANELEILIAKAPDTEPTAGDYPARGEYIKAKLRYTIASHRAKQTQGK